MRTQADDAIEVGVSPSQFNDIIRGRIPCPRRWARKLSSVSGVTVDIIMASPLEAVREAFRDVYPVRGEEIKAA